MKNRGLARRLQSLPDSGAAACGAAARHGRERSFGDLQHLVADLNEAVAV
jgi:hypothetical protein